MLLSPASVRDHGRSRRIFERHGESCRFRAGFKGRIDRRIAPRFVSLITVYLSSAFEGHESYSVSYYVRWIYSQDHRIRFRSRGSEGLRNRNVMLRNRNVKCNVYICIHINVSLYENSHTINNNDRYIILERKNR